MIYIVAPGGTREKGGIGRVVDNIAAELAANHPDVRFEVIDTYGPGSFRRMPLWFLGSMLRLGAGLLSGRAQLVHVHMAERGSVLRKGTAMALARLFGVPVVLHLHAGQFHQQVAAAGPVQRALLRFAVGLADEMVVLGAFYRDFVERSFVGAVRRVTVLHNAVPGPATVPVRRGDGPLRLLFLGRLVPVKGLSILFEALSDPALRDRPWTLTVVGDGDREGHEAMVRERGLTDRVHFTGWLSQEECRRELAAADVLVQPSFAEGLPMAVLEAMAHGLAIVATPVGAVTDAVADGVNGLIVPAGEPLPLANALARLIDDPALRRRLAARARADFEHRFHLGAYMQRLLDIYRRNARYWPTQPLRPAQGAPRP